MDIEVILDAVGSEAPGLQELARRFLEAEAQHLGVTLDLASVMARRTEGVPEVHIAGAADRLAEHHRPSRTPSAKTAPSWCWPELVHKRW